MTTETDDYVRRLRALADTLQAVTTLARVVTEIDDRGFSLTADHPWLLNAFAEVDRLGLGTVTGQTLTVHPGRVEPLERRVAQSEAGTVR